MMHLCIVATLCFFKIISPRNYYFCDQDDFPWVYGSKYVSKSNYCQLLFVFYILDVKSFRTYRNINISNQGGHFRQGVSAPSNLELVREGYLLQFDWLFFFPLLPCLFLNRVRKTGFLRPLLQLECA